MSQRINHPAVWILVALQQALGYIWYSSYFLGPLWQQLRPKIAASAETDTIAPFIWAVVSAFALTYFLAWLIKRLQLQSVGAAVIAALILWLCVSFFELATQYAFLKLPFALTLIDTGRNLVNYILVAVVLSVWRKDKKRMHKRK
jgi:hypothetical protein